ncbi:MAG: hypothetical protein ACE5G2_10935 [Candidatus Krumholzibacteriia bacterium]
MTLEPVARKQRSPFRSAGVVLWAAVAAGVFSFTGCGDNGPEPEPPLAHPEQPGSNDLVLQENVGDEPSTSFWRALRRAGTGYYFQGLLSGVAFGALDAAGRVLWSQSPDYNIAGIGVSPGDAPVLPHALLAVGGKDTDGDDELDTAIVAVVDEDGNQVDRLEWTVEDQALVFRSIAVAASDTASVQFLVVGEQTDASGTPTPVVATVTLLPDSTLRSDSLQVFSELTNITFGDVVPDTPGSGWFVSGTRFDAMGELLNVVVCRVSAARELAWLEDIVAIPGFATQTYDGALAVTSDAVFIVGDTEVERTDANDLPWSAGMAAALTKLGEVTWIETVDLSRWGDRFYGCQVVRGVLYAAGRYAGFANVPTERAFGYAWLYEMDAATGEMQAHLTFGGDQHQSGFNDISIGQSTSRAFGWTERRESGTFRSWFVELDVGWGKPGKALAAAPRPTFDHARGVQFERRPPETDRRGLHARTD